MASKKQVTAGKLVIGGGAPVSVQSMTNTDTRDREATLAQIQRLAKAGCDLVRVSVFDRDSCANVRYLVDHSPVPLSADIHFDWKLAVGSVENGIHSLRINPGNIGGSDRVRLVADACRQHHVPIRVGVNSGSLEKDILARYGRVTAEGMVESALRHAGMLEEAGFGDIVLSLKSSDRRTTVEAYRRCASRCDYPLHVGITEAGLPGQGTLKSAIGIGALLLDGIGDTVRVSLTGDPVEEPGAAIAILKAVGIRKGFRLVSCPTCGRTRLDTPAIAKKVEEAFRDETREITVAVMGCVVNGPGEAGEAQVALCGGDGCGALYIDGKYARRLTGDIAAEFIRAVRSYLDEVR